MKKAIMLFTLLFLFSVIAYGADSNVRLNSIGFLPNNVKGVTSSMNGTTFTVVRVSDGATVYTGTLGGAVTAGDSGETVYKGDFSTFTTPGTYRVNVASVGNSVNFIIADDVYNSTYVTAMRAMYLWRCNTAVSGTYGADTFSHPACHMNDAYQDYTTGSHTIRDGKGGWHDAGDYNKYIVNAGITVGMMFMAWEHYGSVLANIPLSIPDTAPAYPEYLKEMKYEIDWVLKMAYSDGTGRVSAKLSALAFDIFEMPQLETEDRFFTDWGSAATADYCAMLAMAGRIFRPYDVVYADWCTNSATVAYNYLRANTANKDPDYSAFGTGGYGTTDADDRLWAASEMWATTGSTTAHQDFTVWAAAYTDKTDENFDWGNVKNLGMYTYLMCTRTGKVAAIRDDIQADIITDANAIRDKRNSHGYARPLGTYYEWGCNGEVARQAMNLMIANMVSPNTDYVNTTLDALGYLLGRNMHRRSYITGVGVSPPMFPHDRRSGSDGITNPWPGYLVGGSSGARNDPWQTTNLAAGLPAAQYWSDAQDSYSSNEIAINWQGALIYALAAFAKNLTTPTNTPTYTRSTTATFTVTGTPPTPTITQTRTQTSTVTPIPTPGVVNADCAQGATFTINGNLNEAPWSSGSWTNITRTVEGTQGAVSARYQVKWDSTYIYVGVEVTDPVLCNTNATWYQDDSVEIYLDMNHNASATYAADDYQLSIRYGVATLYINPTGQTSAFTAATAVIAGGYAAEFRIPWADSGKTPAAGLTIGFDIGVNHDETCGGTRTGVLMWNGTANNYADTSAFGNAVMQSCGTTPTFTPTSTRTRTITPTFTPTRTATASFTNTYTRTATQTVTSTIPLTPTFTATNTVTPTFTGSPSLTRTSTPTYTSTPTRTPSPTYTSTNIPTFTSTALPSGTITVSPTGTATVTITQSPLPTFTATPSRTQTATGTSTPTRTPSFTPTWTRTASPTRTATQTFTATESSTISATVTQTPTGTPPTPTNTPTITVTYTVTETETLIPTDTFTSTELPTVTETGTPTVTRTSTLFPTQTYTATPTITNTSTLLPTGSPTRTPTNVPTFTSTPPATFTSTIVSTFTSTAISTPSYTRTSTAISTPTLTHTQQSTPSFTVTQTTVPDTPTQTSTYETPTATATPVPVTPTPVIEAGIYPNPYNPGDGDLTVNYSLSETATSVKFRLYTRAFRLVREATLHGKDAGMNTDTVRAGVFSSLSKGIYLYIVISKGQDGVERMSRIKEIIIMR